MPGSPRLEGKVALVTGRISLIALSDMSHIIIGGGSGFGAVIAKRFAEEGAEVIIADINVEGGRKVEESHERITFYEMDVTERNDWEKILEFINSWRHLERLNIVVNNAGTSYRNKPTEKVTDEEWETVFRVNVKSIYLSAAVLLPFMVQQGGGGSVINISSTGASRPRPGLVWYNASKAAVTNATKGLAAEYGSHNIRVNSVAPLLSGTGLFPQFTGMEDTPENRQKFIGNVPLGRLTEAEDVSNMCLYLASDEASFINGTELVIDGGKCV